MYTNNIFSLQRFNKVFRNLFVENRKFYFRFFVLSFALFLLFDLLKNYSIYHTAMVTGNTHGCNDNDYIRNIDLFIGWLFSLGCVFAFQVTRDMRKKGSRIFALSIPATTFEKWLSRWIVHTLFFIVVIWLIFFVVDGLQVMIFRYMFPNQVIEPLKITGFIRIMEQKPWASLFIMYFLAQSLFMLFAYIFPTPKAKPVLIICVIILLEVLMYVCTAISKIPFISLNIQFILLLFKWIMVFLSLMNWVLSYYCFKKLDITNR